MMKSNHLVYVCFLTDLHVIFSLMDRVSYCPCDEETWSQRAEEYNCTRRNYTCMLTETGDLVETCIMPYHFNEGEDGCPYIKREVSGFGPQIGGRLFPCEQEGCPPQNHTLYYITEMYKYPACWIPMDQQQSRNFTLYLESLCPSTSVRRGDLHDTTNVDTESNSSGLTLYITIPTAGIIVIIIVIVVVILRRRKRNLSEGRGEHIQIQSPS